VVAVVCEAGREPLDQAGASIDLAREEHGAVGAEVATFEIGPHFAVAEALKIEGLLDTLCHAAVWFFRVMR